MPSNIRRPRCRKTSSAKNATFYNILQACFSSTIRNETNYAVINITNRSFEITRTNVSVIRDFRYVQSRAIVRGGVIVGTAARLSTITRGKSVSVERRNNGTGVSNSLASNGQLDGETNAALTSRKWAVRGS